MCRFRSMRALPIIGTRLIKMSTLPATGYIGFALIALGMVLTPGPNMIYLISHSICQGRVAGLISLGGVALGFVFYMLCAAFGITALVFAVPYAYDALRFCGAAYLLWLAWQAIRSGGRSPFRVQRLPADSPVKLFSMGFVTNLLNPKIAMLYCRNSSIRRLVMCLFNRSLSASRRLQSASR